MPACVQRGFSRSIIVAANEDDPSSAASGLPPEVPRSGLGADLGSGKGRCLVEGEWNSQIYDPLLAAVAPEDVHCAKNRLSGMWNDRQPLWRQLAGAGTRTVFFAGVNVDQCVLSTLTDAYSAGWDCVLVEDCAATRTPGGMDVCLHNISVSLFSPLCCTQSLSRSMRRQFMRVVLLTESISSSLTGLWLIAGGLWPGSQYDSRIVITAPVPTVRE